MGSINRQSKGQNQAILHSANVLKSSTNNRACSPKASKAITKHHNHYHRNLRHHNHHHNPHHHHHLHLSNHYHSQPIGQQQNTNNKRLSRSLVGNFEENILNNRLEPIRTVDGYTAEVRASSSQYQPDPLRSGVKMNFYSMGDSFPYLGQIHIGSRGYRIPKRGTIQVTLFNPHGTLVKLFLLPYDLSDMPPNSQTFMRQKTLFLARTKDDVKPNEYVDNNKQQQIPIVTRRVNYLIQLNIVSSKSGRIYLNRDVRIFISKKSDLETASQLSNQAYEVKAFNEMPSNPRYSAR